MSVSQIDKRATELHYRGGDAATHRSANGKGDGTNAPSGWWHQRAVQIVEGRDTRHVYTSGSRIGFVVRKRKRPKAS